MSEKTIRVYTNAKTEKDLLEFQIKSLERKVYESEVERRKLVDEIRKARSILEEIPKDKLELVANILRLITESKY